MRRYLLYIAGIPVSFLPAVIRHYKVDDVMKEN